MTELAELVGVIRDVIMIIAFLISIALLAGLFFLYRKLSRLLDSGRRTVTSLEEVAEAVSKKIVGPAAAGSGVAFGLGKAAAFVRGFRTSKTRKGEGNDGE